MSECARAFSRLHVRETRTHVLLPLSPNHGQFGNDGLYGEAKAALEAMLNRWGSEQSAWGRHTSLVGARIGWVRGTGLMNVNNAIAPGLEARAGVRTFSAAEMGLAARRCCADACARSRPRRPSSPTSPAAWTPSATSPASPARSAPSITARVARAKRLRRSAPTRRSALGRARGRRAPRADARAALRTTTSRSRRCPPERARASLGDAAITSTSIARRRDRRPRRGRPLGQRPHALVDGVHGRAQRRGVHRARVDDRAHPLREEPPARRLGGRASGEPMREQDVKARYEAPLLEDAGIRIVDPSMQNGFDPRKLTVWADVALEQDFVFPVPGRAEGQAFVAPRATARGSSSTRRRTAGSSSAQGDAWSRSPAPRGSTATWRGRSPRAGTPCATASPSDLVEQVDRTTLYNLVATVEAFLSAGLEPEELYELPAPLRRRQSTQGAGIGGMQKLRRLYLDHPLDRPRQGDALQETLINVTAAWVVQTLVGSYGPMSHPVGACATAAVSLEDAADKVLGGKAAFIVAGGFDDYGEEGAVGFADMAATCDTDDMLARGIPPREMSRPNDRRRRGFVEAQGGGTAARLRAADVAVRMGLPIYAVVALARSYADGIHRSIPAPGPGVMAVAAERRAPRRRGHRRRALRPGRAACPVAARSPRTAPRSRDTLGEERAAFRGPRERRRLFHDIQAGDERISPLRRALAVFGLVPRRHRRRVEARHLHRRQRPQREPRVRPHLPLARARAGQPPRGGVTEGPHGSLQGRRRGVAGRGAVSGPRDAHRAGQPQPRRPRPRDARVRDRGLQRRAHAPRAGRLRSGHRHLARLRTRRRDRVPGAPRPRARGPRRRGVRDLRRAPADARERSRLRDELAVLEGDAPRRADPHGQDLPGARGRRATRASTPSRPCSSTRRREGSPAEVPSWREAWPSASRRARRAAQASPTEV